MLRAIFLGALDLYIGFARLILARVLGEFLVLNIRAATLQLRSSHVIAIQTSMASLSPSRSSTETRVVILSCLRMNRGSARQKYRSREECLQSCRILMNNFMNK